MRTFRQYNTGGVGTNVTCDARQYIDICPVVQFEVEFTRWAGDGKAGCQRKRCAAKLHRVDAQQQVMHDRVADQHHLENVIDGNACLAGHFLRQLVQGLAHHGSHFLVAAGVHHHVGHAAHQVFAKADLRVHEPGGCLDLAGGKVAQVRRDGGRADVHRHAIGLVVEARPQRHDARHLAGHAVMHGNGNAPFALAQRGLQGLHDGQVAGQVLNAPLQPQRIIHTLHVG